MLSDYFIYIYFIILILNSNYIINLTPALIIIITTNVKTIGS